MCQLYSAPVEVKRYECALLTSLSISLADAFADGKASRGGTQNALSKLDKRFYETTQLVCLF